MKYENFDKVAEIVKELNRLTKELEQLNEYNLEVRISTEFAGSYCYQRITVNPSVENPEIPPHLFKNLAYIFVDACKESLREQIEYLKSELEEL